jgi:hypothetical protein
MTLSRLSLHILPNSSDAEAFLRAAQPPYAKLVDNFGLAVTLANLPITFIGRLTRGDEYDPNSPNFQDPLRDALNYFFWLLPTISANSFITIWSGPNEPHPQSEGAMINYGLFCAEFLRLLATIGKRGVVGEFSVGTPGQASALGTDLDKVINDWVLLAPALAAAKTYNGFVGVHEYLVAKFIDSDWIDASLPMEQRTIRSDWRGWFGGRYRFLGDACVLLKMTRPPLLITELGIGEGALAPFRVSLGGDGRRYAEDYLIPYDRLLATDDVPQAFVFTAGDAADGRWSQFKIDGAGVTGRLLEYEAALAALEGLPPPEPVPEPEPPPTVELHPFGTREFYWVIELFRAAFGPDKYKAIIERIPVDATSTLLDKENALVTHLTYTGPATVEALPGLTADQRATLVIQMRDWHWIE